MQNWKVFIYPFPDMKTIHPPWKYSPTKACMNNLK